MFKQNTARPPCMNHEAAQRAAKARWGHEVGMATEPRDGGPRCAVGVRFTLFGRVIASIAYGRGATWELAFRDCELAGIEPTT